MLLHLLLFLNYPNSTGWTTSTTCVGSTTPNGYQKAFNHHKCSPSIGFITKIEKKTDIKTGPFSLEMFNCAASDLSDKEVINPKKYSKYLNKKPKPI